ncbi:hypothetical protein NUI01_06305 [Corynebacterium sp. MC-17D]|uniref:Uncharacterized protein n=1 Tax=Corynebacterium lipophilum TaxID=2804918 RepID=A0AAW5HWX3_9CORY|nr:hypothetical protein [Corynebacterium lipophilum]MCO6394733.1 hypothetical protein [Corynebacterium lipophilum]MCZ2117304.1 hypothetical protein [Corynebacterium lipophilum]
MSTDVHASYFLADSYGPRLKKIDEESRALLTEYQTLQPPLVSPDMDVTNLRGAAFPRSSVERIRDSDLGEEERQNAITYLLGCWYIDQVDGVWDFVPMLVDKPALYLSFGLGVRTENGSMLIVAESAREIMEGGDLAFTEALYTSSVKVEHRLAEEGSRSEETST